MPMILSPIQAKDRWMDLDKKKPTSSEDAVLRSISFTPPKWQFLIINYTNFINLLLTNMINILLIN